ncbi:Bet1-like protein [Acorus calamus]|uniref:Bet1-like protein n=1 Tax=Acorus calamus TaxID=4465 RepID=A0AAV9F9D8_ACOCL|nr:Bet1-like protein [Acorus calamus]
MQKLLIKTTLPPGSGFDRSRRRLKSQNKRKKKTLKIELVPPPPVRKSNKSVLDRSINARRRTVSPMENPYGSGSLRSREGVSARSGTNSDEIQLRIDPMHADLDEEINGLYGKVRQLRNVAQEIETEAKVQKDFVSELQMTLIKAQAGMKNNMRRLNRSIIRQGSNHVTHVVLFALFCFFMVYLWSKFSRR